MPYFPPPSSGSGTPASTVTSERSFAVASAVGVSTNYAREDHTHGTFDIGETLTVPTTDVTLDVNCSAVVSEEYVMDATHELIFSNPSEMAVL